MTFVTHCTKLNVNVNNRHGYKPVTRNSNPKINSYFWKGYFVGKPSVLLIPRLLNFRNEQNTVFYLPDIPV